MVIELLSAEKKNRRIELNKVTDDYGVFYEVCLYIDDEEIDLLSSDEKYHAELDTAVFAFDVFLRHWLENELLWKD